MQVIAFPAAKPANRLQALAALPAWTPSEWAAIVDHARNVKLSRQAARRLHKAGEPGRARCLLAVSRTRAAIVARAAAETIAHQVPA